MKINGAAVSIVFFNSLVSVGYADWSGYGGSYSKSWENAESIGMSGANQILLDGLPGMVGNPGSLNLVAGHEFLLAGDYGGDLPSGVLGYGTLLGFFPLHIGLHYAGRGDDLFAEHSFGIGAAYSFPQVSLGAALEMQYAGSGAAGEDFWDPVESKNRRVDFSAMSTPSLALGLRLLPLLDKRLELAATLHHLFAFMFWSGTQEASIADGSRVERLPMQFDAALKYQMDSYLGIFANINPRLDNDHGAKVSLGLELKPLAEGLGFIQRERFSDWLMLRCGYSRETLTSESISVLGTGFGMRFPMPQQGKGSIDLGLHWPLETSESPSYSVTLRYSFGG